MMFGFIVLVISVFSSAESVIPVMPDLGAIWPTEPPAPVVPSEDPTLAPILARLIELESSRRLDRMYDTQMNRKVAKLQERVATLEQGARITNTLLSKQGRETEKLEDLLIETQDTLKKKNAQLASEMRALSFKDTKNLLTLTNDIKSLAEKDAASKTASQPWYLRKLANDVKTLQANNTELTTKVNTLVAIDRKLATAMKILVADNSQMASEVQTLNANITTPVQLEELEELEAKMISMTANSTQNIIAELGVEMDSLVANCSKLEKKMAEKSMMLADEVKMIIAMGHRQIAHDVKRLEQRDSELRIEMIAMRANHTLLAEDVTALADSPASSTQMASELEKMSSDIAALYEADALLATNIKILGAKDEQIAEDITNLTSGIETLSAKAKATKLSKLAQEIKTLGKENGQFVTKLDTLRENNVQLATIIKTKIESLVAKDIELKTEVTNLGADCTLIADDVRLLDTKHTKVAAVTKILAENAGLNPALSPAAANAGGIGAAGGLSADITDLETKVEILLANDAQLISKMKELFAKDVELDNTLKNLVDGNDFVAVTTMELVANCTQLAADVNALQTFDVELAIQVEDLKLNTTQFAKDINAYLAQRDDDIKDLVQKDMDLTQDVYTAWMCSDNGIKCFTYYTFKSGSVDYKLLLEQISSKVPKGQRKRHPMYN